MGKKIINSRLKTVGTFAIAISVVAACSSGASTGASGSTTTSKSKAPINFSFLWEVAGESGVGISDFQNGAQLAVDQINASGGVNGQKISAKRYSSSASDASQATSTYIQAAGTKPAMMFGPPGPIVQVLPRYENQYKIPILSVSPDAKSAVGQKFGTKWRFQPQLNQETEAVQSLDFAVNQLHAKKIGILYSVDASNGPLGGAIEKAAKSAGVTVVASKSFSPTATDLVGPVLAMKGADAVIVYTYPNPEAAITNEMVQNGLNIPIVTDDFVFSEIQAGQVSAPAQKNLYISSGCRLYDSKVSRAASFLKAYNGKYKAKATTSAAFAYDDVYIAAAAIKAAGTTTSAAIQKTLTTISYTDGVCTPLYKSDAAQFMNHSVYTYSMKTGTPTVVSSKTVGTK